MNAQLSPNPLPLGDYQPSDRWQTHVNHIFYGIQGPGIHNHFQTYVSLDHRLAHTLAENYFTRSPRQAGGSGPARFIMEWGVGNGNLAACFLTRLKELDAGGEIYSRTHYILCDYSREILNGVRANPRLQQHAGHFSTVQADAVRLHCFRPRSVCHILSNEIWDDLATKVLLKHGGSLFEEYLQPCLDPAQVPMEFEAFRQIFIEKDLEALKRCPPFLPAIVWERDFQRVDIGDWPYAKIIEDQMETLEDDIPIPVNLGAFTTLESAYGLLGPGNLGYTGMDYGMFSRHELNTEGRPYFNLYGGQYTFMVNFDLLGEVGRSIGFEAVEKKPQHRFVGARLKENVLSVLEVVQTHPEIADMAPWDRDILMLKTLHALNGTYQNPYKQKMQYPVLPGTPKKQRKQIARLVENLSVTGVPDTVAYVTEEEVFAALKQLKRLGYREKPLRRAFDDPGQPIAFTCINFRRGPESPDGA